MLAKRPLTVVGKMIALGPASTAINLLFSNVMLFKTKMLEFERYFHIKATNRGHYQKTRG